MCQQVPIVILGPTFQSLVYDSKALRADPEFNDENGVFGNNDDNNLTYDYKSSLDQFSKLYVWVRSRGQLAL